MADTNDKFSVLCEQLDGEIRKKFLQEMESVCLKTADLIKCKINDNNHDVIYGELMSVIMQLSVMTFDYSLQFAYDIVKKGITLTGSVPESQE